MGTWGTGNFENDAALDFINEQVNHYIHLIEAIFSDEQRFRLDEDAEGMLIPGVELLSLLCEHCNGVLPETLNVAAWGERYLAMYDEQIDELEPVAGFKEQRRNIIQATFDKLRHQYETQWRHDTEARQ